MGDAVVCAVIVFPLDGQHRRALRRLRRNHEGEEGVFRDTAPEIADEHHLIVEPANQAGDVMRLGNHAAAFVNDAGLHRMPDKQLHFEPARDGLAAHTDAVAGR